MALMPSWSTRAAHISSDAAAPATVDTGIFGWGSDEDVDAEVAELTGSPISFRGYASKVRCARPSAPPPTRCATPPRRRNRPPFGVPATGGERPKKAPVAVRAPCARPPTRGARRVLMTSTRANVLPPPPPKKDLLRSLAAAAGDAPLRPLVDQLHPLAAPPTPPRALPLECPPSTVSRSDRSTLASPAARLSEPPRRRPRRVDKSDPVSLFAHRQADWERQRRAARRRRRAA